MIDAEALSESDLALNDRDAKLAVEGDAVDLSGGRGWLRRLAAEDWRSRMAPELYEGVVRQSWLAALTALIEVVQVEWLSELRAAFAAEEKLVQQRACRELGSPLYLRYWPPDPIGFQVISGIGSLLSPSPQGTS